MRLLSHCMITELDGNVDFERLYEIFSATLSPGMNRRFFRAFYYAPELKYIDVSFIMEDDKIIGFCAAAFYQIKANEQEYIIGRAATGVLPDYQGGALPVSTLFYKFIRYKLHHPLARLVLTGYIANPIVYDMICRYTGWSYPRMGQKLPSHLSAFHQAIVPEKIKVPGKHPMVVRLHFHVQQGAGMVKRVMGSASRFVKDYLHMNPDYNGHYGLVVLVPITWANIGVSMSKLVWKYCVRYFKHKNIRT